MAGYLITLNDEEDDRHASFHYEKGIIEFVEELNKNKNVLHDVFAFNASKDRIEVDVAMQYTDSYNENIVSFVNNVKTIDGGSHEVGFKTALTRVFNEYAKSNNLFKGTKAFEGSDVREGLTAIINLKIPEDLLQFEGQTKSKLGTPSARVAVENLTTENLKIYLEENRVVATSML